MCASGVGVGVWVGGCAVSGDVKAPQSMKPINT